MRLARAVPFLLAFGVAIAAADPALAQGCALCKTVLTGSKEGQAIARQFNEAIIVLLFAPYMVFGSLAAFAFRSRIREGLRRSLPRIFR
jgi:hypothetical protein